MKRSMSQALVLLVFAWAAVPALADTTPGTSIVDAYPGLKNFVAREQESSLYFGFGLSPLMIVSNKIGFSASLFQLHWIRDSWDIEIFNGSFSSIFGQQYGNEQTFTLRTSPKFRLFGNISLGPLLGAEFVHFPSVTEELNKNNEYTKPFEFSTIGMIYGATLAETFPIGNVEDHHLLKVNQTFYKETYSVTGTRNGWDYFFSPDSLNSDPSPIQAGTVFTIELSYLY